MVVGRIPGQAPHFVDREQVRQLQEMLRHTSVAVVVCGMRGAGKTQIAAAYAREVTATGEPGAVVGWIGAETTDTALAGFTEVATALGVADPDGDSLASARRLRDHLNSARESSGVLVFDNATDPDFLAEFLPTSGRVRVVITSTDRAFTSFGELVDAREGFERSESVQFLKTATRLDDPEGADGLAAELGDLPLALAAAAATITRLKLNYEQYLRALAAQPLPVVLLRQRGGYERAVDQALQLAIDTVTRANGDKAVDERVRWLVGVMATLSADGVEAKLLTGEDDSDFLTNVAIARCVESSLVSWSTGGRVLVMHRLTARQVREHAQAAGALDALAANAATVLGPHLFDPNEAFQRRSEGARLVDHIETLAEHTHQHPAISPGTHAAILAARRWATCQLIRAADLRPAISLAERTYADHRHHLGDMDPAALTAHANLAYAYRRAGRIGEAIDLYERLLADRQRILGVEDPSTLDTRHHLALTYR
ncbi:tetratricopeptide repeat protein, partial [Nocardia shimofusensis]|uniref:tetratricopeptide repeat protein n=1 Tax=Nocardia shimofusensis TaxID=228596 RepID=UPI001471FBAD